eukprot:m.28482 g.28482  ORF g.28482 m.28482 type:complete len:65 (+) comp4521_c0_seq1:1085-1279(+)
MKISRALLHNVRICPSVSILHCFNVSMYPSPSLVDHPDVVVVSMAARTPHDQPQWQGGGRCYAS